MTVLFDEVYIYFILILYKVVDSSVLQYQTAFHRFSSVGKKKIFEPIFIESNLAYKT